jgi:TPR repeat protein
MSASTTPPTPPTVTLKHPRLPPLYFGGDDDEDAPSLTTSADVALPPEVWATVLSHYADWGDLAKLATTQRRWRTLVEDAAAYGGTEARWALAQALLQGTRGLAVNRRQALAQLHVLANVAVDDEGFPLKAATGDSNNSDNNITSDEGFFAPAMMEIATLYLGDGTAPTTSTDVNMTNATTTAIPTCARKGLAWLVAAFEQGGDPAAAYRLGVLYEREYAKATGSRQDNDDTSNNNNNNNNHSITIEVDVYAAKKWFEAAAEAGHLDAMVELALCYELGCGTEQSDEQALDWYMRAAQAGHVTAKFSVGEAFEEARGVPQSDEEACLWYYKAAVAGCDDSVVALQRLSDIARIVVPGVGQLFEA